MTTRLLAGLAALTMVLPASSMAQETPAPLRMADGAPYVSGCYGSIVPPRRAGQAGRSIHVGQQTVIARSPTVSSPSNRSSRSRAMAPPSRPPRT